MLLLSYLRKFLTASLVAVAIVACDGSSGGAATSTADPFASDPNANQPIPQEILGSDIDSDGIQDDLQTYIEQTYIEHPAQMRAVKRMARIERRALSVFNDVNALNNIAAEDYHATNCWIESMRDPENSLSNEEQEYIARRIVEYQELTRNTPDREYFMNILDVRLARIYGESSFSQLVVPCE